MSVLGGAKQCRIDNALLERGDQRGYFLQVSKFHIHVGLQPILSEQHVTGDIGRRAFVGCAQGFARQSFDVGDLRLAVD